MITVACVWVKANVPYGHEYVTRLQAMAVRNLDRPHRFVCLTDRPWMLPDGIETRVIQSPAGMCGWWSKVQLFNPAMAFDGRVVYLDLDSLVVSSLAPIVDYAAPFALVPDGGTFSGRSGLQVVKRFNSSVMVWDAGTQTDLFTGWAPAVADRLWGDQDWIGEQKPLASQFPAAWFPRISELGESTPGPDVKVVLCKKPKNDVAAARLSWVANIWRAA